MLGGILGSIAGSVVTGLFNKDSAEDNRDFQEEMSSTAHQREVADLKAAGLNPMLSAKLGGASSPGGSTATMPDLGASINSATVASKTKAEIDKIKADTATSESQARLNEVQAIAKDAETRLTLANAANVEWEYAKKEYLKNTFDSWFVEGKQWDAKLLQANYDRLKASNDYNTVRYLNEFAVEQGYRNFDEAVHSQAFRKDFQAYLYDQLKFPEAEAKADFYKTPYGREIAPYLSSAGGASDLIGVVGSGLSLGKRIFGNGPMRFSK